MPFYFWVNSMSVAQLQSRHLILFDLDGTLVDSAADLYRAMNLSLEKLQFPLVTEEQVRAWVGKGAAKLCETVLEHIFGQVNTEQQKNASVGLISIIILVILAVIAWLFFK